ncbi:hypothetical protein RvY_03341 [Ramazzottius varieornatus]|uniref:Uncharacterized protein n=1 Tax=Ramazzottius varieornatus TaxID=947166 RepID=A0A1D1UX46_RAMVA|nr:hypothetical protein RvY_03341 [Ramazzottius varieornatus]
MTLTSQPRAQGPSDSSTVNRKMAPAAYESTRLTLPDVEGRLNIAEASTKANERLN